jgi:hypothetical protein
MKTLILTLLLILPSLTTHAAPRAGSPEHDFGLGFASFGAGLVATSAISAWIPINHTTGVQTYLSIPTTSGNFNFYAGGAYKATLEGTAQTGFHIGGDLLFGATAGEFTLLAGGLMGIHYTPAPALLFAFDGGPQISMIKSQADFSMGGLSGILGASLIYFF